MNIKYTLLYTALTIIPLLCLIYYVSEYMVDVPFLDQWARIPLFEKAYEGTLTFKDLWVQSNYDHRPLFPRLIMIGLVRISKWKISYEITTNILFSIATFLTITYQIRLTNKFLKNSKPCWLIPIISMIIFSLTQSTNWLWGWTMIIFLNVFAITSGFIILSNFGTKWAGFCSAAILGIIGTYSFANGLLYWPIGLFILFFINHQDKKNKILKLILWTATSILIIGSYMYAFKTNPRHPSMLFCLSHPFQYLGYFLSYLGSPLFCFRNLIAAMLLGLSGLIIFVFMIHDLIKYQNIKFQVLAPYIALSFYSIGAGLLTGTGRLWFGLRQALSSRYVTTSSLFWISNIILFYLYINVRQNRLKEKLIFTETDKTDSATASPKGFWQLCSKELSSQAKSVSIITIVAVLIFANSISSITNFKRKYSQLAPAREALMAGKSDDEVLKHLHPIPEKIKTGTEILKKYKLSVFRDEQSDNH